MTNNMSLHNWFLPHKDTHKKAHLLNLEAMLIYVLLFIGLQVGFSIFSYLKPGVLGVAGNIETKKVIELTNAERAKKGLGTVVENEALNKAAYLKGQNMFQENYWAHFAPSGKSPWDFIQGAGYRFTYAGENLAKNFYNSDDVVVAWMNSPSHRDNLLNEHYKDIGVAVVTGILNGQETTLVVQEFGTTEFLANKPAVSVSGKQVNVPTEALNNASSVVSTLVQGSETKISPPVLDPYLFTKYAGVSVISFLAGLMVIDLIVLKKRGVLRLGSHHIAHMSILGVAAATILASGPGAIL